MSSIRKRFRVAWNDQPAVEIRTNAWDGTVANDYQHNPTLATFAMIHHALDRLGHNPPSLEQFVEELDEIEDVDKGDAEDEADAVPPTSPEAGDSVLLRSAASPDLTPTGSSATSDDS